MSKPIILVLEHDPEVLAALEENLQEEYGGQFEVTRADSAVEALERLERLKAEGEAVSLFLVSSDMPQMNGRAFLERALKVYPNARRLVYTSGTDTKQLRETLEGLNVDACLSRPWHEPEVCLYPVLEELLDEDEQVVDPPEGVRVICERWSPKAHEVRDFLARARVPFQFLDVDEDEGARRLLDELQVEDAQFPLVVFADGTYLGDPTDQELANRIGLSTHAQDRVYDLVVIGGGPSGLAAAVYGASEGLKTVVIECEAPGGQAGMSSSIENYLGFPEGLSGGELAHRAVQQAERFGAEILVAQEARGLRVDGSRRVVTLEDGTELFCSAVLVATGVAHRKLDVPGADPLTGAGIYYGAARTEAYAFRDQDICLLGSGNSAGQAAMQFSKYARSVTILTLEPSLEARMSRYLVERLEEAQNIHVKPHTTITEVHGDRRLEALTVKDARTDAEERLQTAGLFVFIGGKPHSDWLEGILAQDEAGFVLAGPDLLRDGEHPWPLERDPLLLETSMPGVFVSGDVRHDSVKRIASAVGEGSMAIQFVHQYLSEYRDERW
jgi:thioredoxin reductase (NADPH)